MADLRISDLPALAGSLLQASDPLAIADLSASETKKITAKDLVQAGVALIDDLSIPGRKVDLTISADSIGTAELKDDSVTAAKLAADSSAVLATPLPAVGAYRGQLAVDDATKFAYIWNDTNWQPFTSSNTVNVVQGGTAGPLITDVTVSGDVRTVLTRIGDSTGARQFLGGPAASGGPVTLRALTAEDLPKATNADVGAVAVAVGSGLRLDGGPSGLLANIEVDNDVTLSATPVLVSFNAKGLVTGGRAISSTDLPSATAGSVGAIAAGAEFTVDPAGILHHANAVTAGTGTKLTYDATGHITGSATLAADDIPDLPATKLTSGSIDLDRIPDRGITAQKLAQYATAYIQDTQPGGVDHFAGQLWLNPLAQQIRMWDSNVWVPIGVGALSEQNLRFCGLIDAATGRVTVITKFGQDAGFKVGDPPPAATEQLTGAYLVIDTPGNNIGVTTGVNYDAGDWVVCIGIAGYERVDTLNGSGGGGGAVSLGGLLDVTLTGVATGEFLGWNGLAWVNTTVPTATTTVFGTVRLADDAAVTAGTAGRVVTADQLKTTNDAVASNTTNITTIQGDITTIQGQVADASEITKGIVQLATNAEVATGTDTLKATTPAGVASHYLAKNIALLAALP